MVVQVRWIKGLFHLMLLLRAAAETTQLVREGDKAMLTCGNLKENPAKCGGTTWTFTAAGTRTAQELVTLGRVKEIRQLRISLSEDCSLLIPEVRAEDAGHYICRQFRSEASDQLPDAPMYLTVVTLTAQVNVDYVRLTCCVFTYKTCSHKVTWLFNEVQMEKGTGLVLTSQNSCSASVNVMTYHEYWRRNTLLTCQVQYDQVVKTFPLRAPDVASAETTTTVSTRTADDSAPLRAVEKNCNDGRNTHSAVTHSSPEISQDKRDAEDPVSYATIMFRVKEKIVMVEK